jgi:hypothetical protein
MEVHGKGAHAITGDPYSGENLVRIEVIASMEVGEAILNYIHAAQFGHLGHYALSAYADIVDVDTRDRSLSD